MNKFQFIGNQKIKSEKIEGDFVNVVLEDKTDFKIHKELLKGIKSKKVGSGNLADNINDYFARKFLAELAYYELDYYFVSNVGQAMNVLSHNLRENLIRETFKCSGGNNINLKKLVI